MDKQIKSNLALQVAQLSLDKATLQAEVTQLQQENASLQTQVDELTALLNEQTQPEIFEGE